ncbi:hypothetical protein BH11PAT2_BH11PAT2_03530 [soil metagenome]
MISTFKNTLLCKYWPSSQYHNQLHALYREGILTLGDVMQRTEAEIIRIPMCGRGTVLVLRQVLAKGMRAYLEEVS